MKDAREEMKDLFSSSVTNLWPGGASAQSSAAALLALSPRRSFFTNFFPGDARLLKVICYVLEFYRSR
jgi:hypothetical protein